MGDTIFAEATAPGRAGIAVIRLSGPEALAALARLSPLPCPPRRAVVRMLRDPADDGILDRALVLALPGPGSFTGEDMAEIQCHGSRAVVAALEAALARMPGLRRAAPGEFTRRALGNGRLDLAQVEGLADLLAAETEAQRRQAAALMEGRLSAMAASWRDRIVGALARIEVTIDFADEDLPETVLAEARDLVDAVAAEMRRELAGARAAERVREGFEVALVGPPNAGKSTLLNAIAGRSVAITSPVAGTTRDVIELRFDLGGLAVTFLDMAGLRPTDDPVEGEGVRRASARAGGADMRIILMDGEDQDLSRGLARDGDIVVRCKADLHDLADALRVSAVTGEGMGELMERIATTLAGRAARATAPAHDRQRRAIAQACAALEAATVRLGGPRREPERVADDLQAALRGLDFLVGRTDVETVLDAVFRTFCLGK